jgi:hypothetical protein
MLVLVNIPVNALHLVAFKLEFPNEFVREDELPVEVLRVEYNRCYNTHRVVDIAVIEPGVLIVVVPEALDHEGEQADGAEEEEPERN